MSINKIDYDVLNDAKAVYANQAADLDNLIKTLVRTNGQLQDGWTNQTADAFINRFETDQKVHLESVRDALQEISTYIGNYVENTIANDRQGASAL